MSTVSQAEERLNIAWQSFHQHWSTARAQWRDTVAETFQRRYIELFDRETWATIQALQVLAQVIADAERNVH